MNRNQIILSLTLILSTYLCYSCNVNVEKTELNYNWEELVDIELTNWDMYLSFKHQVGYDGSPPVDESNKEIKPIGLNKAGYNVFTTNIVNDEIIINVSGEYYGCLATKKEYENYHLQLKYKWEKKNGFQE